MITIIGKKYNLNFMLDFDSSDIIIDFSMYMYANQVFLYSFESKTCTNFRIKYYTNWIIRCRNISVQT